MLKALSKLEFVIENKVYTLLCDPDSPLSHAKEAFSQGIAYVVNLENQIKSSLEKPKEEEKLENETPQENLPVEDSQQS